ncbi:MAG: hypothetical protein ACI4CS_06210, partial [Candidatus Weimeria sp.]
YDMEASGIYAALKNAVTPDRITIMKTVTDSGSPDFSKTKQMLEDSADAVCDCIKRTPAEPEIKKADDSLARRLCSEFRCSESMSIQLSQFIRYMEVSGNHDLLMERISELSQKGLLPAPDRRHGKQALAILMNLM